MSQHPHICFVFYGVYAR